MTDVSAGAGRDGRLQELVERMRSQRSRWQHSYGSVDVIYADTVDEWVDELEELLAVPDPLASETGQELQERVDASVAQLLIELAFLLPRGTDVQKHPIAAKLLECFKAIRAQAASSDPLASSSEPQGELLRFIERECRQVSVNNGWGQRHARGLADRILDAIAAAAAAVSSVPVRAGAQELRALVDALATLEGPCGADDRTAAYAVAGAARSYVDALASAPPSDDGARQITKET